MTTQIRFTQRELEMIMSMGAIASAAPWGQGDYIGDEWDSAYAGRIHDSLMEKASALLESFKRSKKTQRTGGRSK